MLGAVLWCLAGSPDILQEPREQQGQPPEEQQSVDETG
ncbi:hypothetical protein ACP70R_043493 [Stipagrostis hirtigluma subsp. patula]